VSRSAARHAIRCAVVARRALSDATTLENELSCFPVAPRPSEARLTAARRTAPDVCSVEQET